MKAILRYSALVVAMLFAVVLIPASGATAGTDGRARFVFESPVVIESRGGASPWYDAWIQVRDGGCVNFGRMYVRAPSGARGYYSGLPAKLCDDNRNGVVHLYGFVLMDGKTESGQWRAKLIYRIGGGDKRHVFDYFIVRNRR